MLVQTFRPNDVSMDDDDHVRELELLVDKLQGIHRTLTSMYSLEKGNRMEANIDVRPSLDAYA